MGLIGEWASVKMPGRTITETHIIPLGDSPAHTAPICWCNPVRRGTDRVWRHRRTGYSQAMTEPTEDQTKVTHTEHTEVVAPPNQAPADESSDENSNGESSSEGSADGGNPDGETDSSE